MRARQQSSGGCRVAASCSKRRSQAVGSQAECSREDARVEVVSADSGAIDH